MFKSTENLPIAIFVSYLFIRLIVYIAVLLGVLYALVHL